MDFFDFLALVGGLAMFLYGMDLMGNNLTLMSGKRLKSILENLTSNKFKAVLLGTGVTAVIQSSSGTTVMVVGLVNSGIMKLKQAIAIIMGANIGTTVTAWILSLAGLESENFFIQMLKPTSFAPILAMLGVVYLLFSKDEKKHAMAKIMLGFAILMFGMETMSKAMKPLANMPEFQKMFLQFSNPILGVLVGAVLTAVIQSSSASVGILQALCATGAVPMSAAIPIIMGQNIGTYITAALSAIGAKRNAKRAALAHLLFNLIGTILFMTFFYGAGALFSMPFVEQQATPVSIAIVHSVFNISNTAILVNFTGLLERLVTFIIPETEEERSEELNVFSVLDDRLLDTPSIALEQSATLSMQMFELAQTTVFDALSLLPQFDVDVYKKVKRNEKKIDSYQDALSGYLFKIGMESLTGKDATDLTIILNCINDFERMSDHALNIAESIKDMRSDELRFSTQAQAELHVYAEALIEITNLTVEAYHMRDSEIAFMVEPLEEVVDRLHEALKLRHIERLRQGICSVDLGMVLTDITTSMERIADHCSNIAVAIIEIKQGAFDAHKYMKKLKKQNNTDFHRLYENYLDRYTLPSGSIDQGIALSTKDLHESSEQLAAQI